MSYRESIDKPFKIGDIIIYSIIFLVVVFCFVAVIFFDNHSDNNGFSVYVDSELYMEYDFSTKKATITENGKPNIEIISENSYKISTTYGFNTILIDNENNTVSVTDTDCGLSRECEHMDFLHGVIICAPHHLRIEANNQNSIPRVG